MKLFDRFKKLRTIHKVLIIIAVLIVGIGGWIAYDNRPRPLGDGMVYLGRDGISGLSYGDHGPYATYYYETDMDEVAMKDYFTANSPDSEGLAFKNAYFSSHEGDFMFFYENDTVYAKKKKYIVSIGDEQYEIARKYLKK
jgi:hypothetical protein